MTPHLTPVGAFDASLDCLSVSGKHAWGELHTSPEIAMKGLLADAPIPIYQICRSFRDDPPSPIHWTEFTMLEFYEPNRTYRDVLNSTRNLFEAVIGHPLLFEEITVAETWRRWVGLDLASLVETHSLVNAVVDKSLCKPTGGDSWEDIFFKVMLTHIEPRLDPLRPTILIDYPERLCTLLENRIEKRVENRSGTVERFELYWHGMELCNGGTELVSVDRLRDRYRIESSHRERMGKRPHPFPQVLSDAMARLPPHAGVAVGLERLSRCLGITV